MSGEGHTVRDVSAEGYRDTVVLGALDGVAIGVSIQGTTRGVRLFRQPSASSAGNIALGSYGLDVDSSI